MDTIPLCDPTIGKEEEAAVLEVLRSGWITTGDKCDRFEQAFCERFGAEDAVALTSGTAALHLALRVLDISEGDEVVTPSITWPSLPNLLVQLGAEPVFVDVEPDTLNIDPEDLDRVVSGDTEAIVPVHFAGRAYDVDRVHAIAQDIDATVIDDAAHAIGTVYEGTPVGGLAELTCFSFHPIKNITTGEGGLLAGKEPALIERARLLKFHGVSRDAGDRYGSEELPHYEVEEPGLKYNLTDIQAAIGLEQLKKLDRFNESRRELAHRYHELLSNLPLKLPPLEDRGNCTHAWHLFVVQVQEDAEVTRDEVMRGLNERAVQTGLHFLPAHTMKPWADSARNLPVTEHVGPRLFSLPLFPGLSHSQQDRVAEELRMILPA